MVTDLPETVSTHSRCWVSPTHAGTVGDIPGAVIRDEGSGRRCLRALGGTSERGIFADRELISRGYLFDFTEDP